MTIETQYCAQSVDAYFAIFTNISSMESRANLKHTAETVN